MWPEAGLTTGLREPGALCSLIRKEAFAFVKSGSQLVAVESPASHPKGAHELQIPAPFQTQPWGVWPMEAIFRILFPHRCCLKSWQHSDLPLQIIPFLVSSSQNREDMLFSKFTVSLNAHHCPCRDTYICGQGRFALRPQAPSSITGGSPLGPAWEQDR